jgi:hypothetical protein
LAFFEESSQREGCGVVAKPTPVERHSFQLEEVTGKNPDGSRRQDVIAKCHVGEAVLLMRGEKGVPSQERVIGVCRKNGGHQIGVIRGTLAARLARPSEYEFVDAIISGIAQVPKLFSRRPELHVSIEVLLYEAGSVPARALEERRFEGMVFHYRPEKEQNAILLQQVGEDLQRLGHVNGDIMARHKNLDKLMRHYYMRKEKDPSGLTKAIIAAQMQISLAEDVRRLFKEEHGKAPLPPHSGYELLCVIREKQRQYEDVIALAEEAQRQGWEHDWKVRIERCRRKLKKREDREAAEH